ncbi:MAG: hypothetical protein PF692_08155 [Kiritimatiellae bacterium]|jgi:hypothetical protein|nr:hypothetical protein [Kiritimatiellia bacterium]
MSDNLENNNENKPNGLKLAKTNSLERELNSTLNKAVHDKYGTEADIDENKKQKIRDRWIRFYTIIVIVIVLSIALIVWVKQGTFIPQDNSEEYGELFSAITSFTVKPRNDTNLNKLAIILMKLSKTTKASDNTIGIGYAVFSVQEIKAGHIELGIADCNKTIIAYPESPCVDNLKKIVAGKTCEDCQGKGVILTKCDVCNGSGRCPKCEGRQTVDTLGGTPIKCNKCSGTGKCPKCLGRRKIESKCEECKGTGNVFDRQIFEKEAAIIMTKALSRSAYKHAKSEVVDVLNKMHKKMNQD